MSAQAASIRKEKTEEAVSPADQRDCERSPFIADIEFFDIDRGGTVLVGRTSDLSCGGCYVDCLCPVPLDAQFRVRIAHDGQTIEAVGLVVYSQPGSGVGVSFTYMAPQNRSILDGWLCQLRGEAGPVRVSAEGAPSKSSGLSARYWLTWWRCCCAAACSPSATATACCANSHPLPIHPADQGLIR